MNEPKQFPTHVVAVYGIVKNDNGEILLLRHRDKRAWMFPGGQVEAGENLINALLRETREESNMDISVDQLYCVTSNTGIYQGYNGYGTVPTKVILGFVCSYISGDFMESDETDQVLWSHRDNVLDVLTTDDSIEKFKAYMNFDGKIKYLEYVSRPEFIVKAERFM
jgi:ADP-ribose pyrophosphatase YjhB (NUDIX family)